MPEEPGSENSTAKRSPAPRSSGKPALAVVQLLDDKTLDVYVERKAKGEKIFDEVCSHLDLREKDYFGLNYRDKAGRKTWLDLDKRVGKVLKAEPWKLDFEVKFYPKDPSQLQEDFTRYLLCLQVRNDILSGKLPCSFVTHAMLGSYLVQSQLGDYSAEEYPDASYLAGFKFCPDRDAAPGLEERVMTLHKGHKGQTPAEAELHYLENAKKLSMYGVDMHPAKDSEGVDILLGVNSTGIQVYQEKLRINRFAWPKILKISYRRNNFYIKIRPGEFEQYEQTVGFKLDSSRAAKNLWKVCVDQHTFFRLMSADATKRPGLLFPRLGSLYRFNRKTQAEVMLPGNPRKDGNFNRHHSLGPSRSLDPLNKPREVDEQAKRNTMPPRATSPKKPAGGVAVLPVGPFKKPKSEKEKDNGTNGLPTNDLEDEEKENRAQRIDEATTPVKDDVQEKNKQSPSSGGLIGIFGKEKKSKDKSRKEKDQDSIKKTKDKEGLTKDKDKDSLRRDKDKETLKKEKDKDSLKKDKDKDSIKKDKDKDSSKKDKDSKKRKGEKIAVAETVSGEFISGEQKSSQDQDPENLILNKSGKDGDDLKGKDGKQSKDSKSKKDKKNSKGDDEGSKSKGMFAFKQDKKDKDKSSKSKDKDDKKPKSGSRKSLTSDDSKNLDSSLERSKTSDKDRSLNDTTTSPYTKVYEYTANEDGINPPKTIDGFSYEAGKTSPNKSGLEKAPTSPGRTERATAFNYAPGDIKKVEGDQSGTGKKFFSIFGSKKRDNAEKQTKGSPEGKGDSSLDKSGSSTSEKSEFSGPVTSTPTGVSDGSKKSKSKDKASLSEKPVKGDKLNESYNFLQAERSIDSPSQGVEDEAKVGPKIVKTTTKSQIVNKGGTLTQNVEESIENVNTGEVTHSSHVNTAEGLDESQTPIITATAVTTRTATTLKDLGTNAETSEVQEKTVATSTTKQGSRQEQRVVTQEVRATTVVNDPQIERSKSSSSLSSDDSGTPIDGDYYPDRPQGPIVETEKVVYSRPLGEDGMGEELRTSSPPLVPTVSQRLEEGTFPLHGTITSQTITSKTRTVETLTYKTEKDGVVETRVEQKITIQSDGDPIDHEKALNDAIQEATAMNPDMRVEKIEIQQEAVP